MKRLLTIILALAFSAGAFAQWRIDPADYRISRRDLQRARQILYSQDPLPARQIPPSREPLPARSSAESQNSRPSLSGALAFNGRAMQLPGRPFLSARSCPLPDAEGL